MNFPLFNHERIMLSRESDAKCLGIVDSTRMELNPFLLRTKYAAAKEMIIMMNNILFTHKKMGKS